MNKKGEAICYEKEKNCRNWDDTCIGSSIISYSYESKRWGKCL